MPLGTPGQVVGDWVLVHVGFAMAKIDEAEATATLDAFRSRESASGLREGHGPFGQMAFEFTRPTAEGAKR